MIRCLLHEWLSALNEGRSDREPGWVRRHRATCLRCAQKASRRLAIAKRLRAEAGREPQAIPPFLVARIHSALARTEPRVGPRAWMGRGRGWGWSVAAAAGLAVILVVGPWFRPEPTDLNLAAFTREQAGRLTQQVRNLSPEPVRALTELDRPLQAELEAILADARAAALSLARVCLPEDAMPPPR